MGGSTFTTFQANLKERYVDSDLVEELVFPENPLLSMLTKKGDTDMMGEYEVVPILYGNPQGHGGGFSIAQTNASNNKSQQFQIQAGEYYGVVEIGDKVLKATRNNRGAFLENKRVEIDGLWESAGEALSIYTWGNGGGALGQIAALDATTVTLVNPSDAQNFEIDMYVTASADDGSVSTHSQRDSNDQTIITGVNRSTGVLTLTTGDISGLAVGDSLFREGDFFGDTGRIVIKGIQSFITATDTPPTLWGITNTTRATDPQRFAGCRVPLTELQGKSYEERIKLLTAYMSGRFKSKMPTAGFMHPEDFQVLETLMTARGLRALEDDNTKFGYMKIDIATGSGRIPIYCDRHCPKGTFFALRMENFWISSMLELLHPQEEDGNVILRRDASTDYEYRLLSYPLLACNAMKNSGRVPLTA